MGVNRPPLPTLDHLGAFGISIHWCMGGNMLRASTDCRLISDRSMLIHDAMLFATGLGREVS